MRDTLSVLGVHPLGFSPVHNGNVIAYDIHSVREVPVGGVRRTEVAIVVEPGATRADLREVAEQVAADRRAAAQYHALVVGFFDYEAFVDHGPYTLGRWEHAPHGQWSEARAALPDYSNFRSADHLVDKDWTRRPDAEAVRLWRSWGGVLNALDQERGIGNHEEDACLIVARQHDVDPAIVRAACEAVTVWPYL